MSSAGIPKEPKWTHLKELHAAVKLSSAPLLAGDQSVVNLGQFQTVRAFIRNYTFSLPVIDFFQAT